MSDQNFSPEDSLLVIQSMIEKTRRGLSDKSHYFLLWGWGTAIACVGQFFLKNVLDSPYHYNVWWITIVCLVIHIIFLIRDRKSATAKTYVSESMNDLWTAMGISFFILSMIFFRIGWLYCFPFFITLYGVGTFISGRVLQFFPFVIGGIICWILAAISIWFSMDYQMLFAAGALLASYIIPGHLLRQKYRSQ
jgi:hypothetical protein